MENIVGFFGSILIVLALLLFTVILVFAIFGFVIGIIEVFNDFKTINKDILKIEDDYYFKNNVFITLSLVLIALFDLNILELDW